MQKNMIKAIGVFTLVLFVLSMTGAAAATCKPCKANPDTFYFSASKHCGDVLSNDQGAGLKVISRTNPKYGTVTMKSNGNFCYKPNTCSKTGTIRDSFVYKIRSSCGQTSTARVTIIYTCH